MRLLMKNATLGKPLRPLGLSATLLFCVACSGMSTLSAPSAPNSLAQRIAQSQIVEPQRRVSAAGAEAQPASSLSPVDVLLKDVDHQRALQFAVDVTDYVGKTGIDRAQAAEFGKKWFQRSDEPTVVHGSAAASAESTYASAWIILFNGGESPPHSGDREFVTDVTGVVMSDQTGEFVAAFGYAHPK